VKRSRKVAREEQPTADGKEEKKEEKGN